ncbi:MAG: universal stress protein [Rickettsiales bacterium]|nr:universal stress protein [Pseudomonadota bacterium]MDA0966370.1 universal stress protein [Pseudomonadota bacterium]MDG4544003.1 universal stress protein [Rickettsiales bacterium]MDG4545497.1 universal stress protein [Rickettsiales bacterium]MDG4547946.1 universal stress protein [Rickettsiales bacterium]
MGKIIACIDGSTHADSVCTLSSWVSGQSGFKISLLHVVAPHTEMEAKGNLSGSIGLGAKSELLEELTKIDEEHGRLELKKGRLMLDHAKEELENLGISTPEILHRRGSLVEIIGELEADVEIIIMGKRGENHNNASNHLGSNLERVARSIHKPLLIATDNPKDIKRFIIAYDGSPSVKKALDYITNTPLLKGADCHLLKAGDDNAQTQAIIKEAEDKLKAASFNVHTHIQKGKQVENFVADYAAANDINLLVIGAYGHSKIRSLILGSTTTSIIRKSDIPVLLFR